jgi:hypothetical protein
MKPLFSDWKFRTCLESVTTIRHWTMHRPFYTNAHLAQITKSNLLPCKLQNASCVQRVPISCLVNSASWCHPIFGSLLENPFEHRRDQGILKDWLGPTNGPIYLEQWLWTDDKFGILILAHVGTYTWGIFSSSYGPCNLWRRFRARWYFVPAKRQMTLKEEFEYAASVFICLTISSVKSSNDVCYLLDIICIEPCQMKKGLWPATWRIGSFGFNPSLWCNL